MRARAAIPLVTLAAASALATAAPPRGSAAASSCPDDYSYAGVVSPRSAAGISATISPLVAPSVVWGHVAAWVGVGGPGAGPGGKDEWLQVGLGGFEQGRSSLYYEVNTPGTGPRYVEVLANVTPLESHRVAVLELAARPSWWRVWVDGRPQGAPVLLPRSHGHWHPQAMTESWNGGRGVCNDYRYAFASVRLAASGGGSWRTFRAGDVLEQGGYRVLARRSGAFVAANG